MTLLVDSGTLIAAIDPREPQHDQCRQLLEAYEGRLIAPQLVLAEVVYFVGRRLSAEIEVRFLGSLAAGEIEAEPVRPADWLRIADLVARYHDLPLGTVDASVVAAAERLGATAIATLDRRDFGAVRPKHVEAFTLVP